MRNEIRAGDRLPAARRSKSSIETVGVDARPTFLGRCAACRSIVLPGYTCAACCASPRDLLRRSAFTPLAITTSGMQETTLGVAIITKNAAARLAECLRSVAFADQIVVIDGGSVDGTADIARAHGAQVIEQTDWPGFGPQKNRAVDALNTAWILSLDADEIVSPELAASIRAALAAPAADVYAVDRLSKFLRALDSSQRLVSGLDSAPVQARRRAFLGRPRSRTACLRHARATPHRQADALLVRGLRVRAAQARCLFERRRAAASCGGPSAAVSARRLAAARGRSCGLTCCAEAFWTAAPAS